MKKLKINDVIDIDEIIVDGISTEFFTRLEDALESILTNSYNVDAEVYDASVMKNLFSDIYTLGLDYFVEHSNEKYISPIFEKLYERYIDELITEQALYTKLASLVADKFAFKWWKISEAITTEYKPLENYDLKELRNVGTDVNVNQSSESGIYGFNSSEASPTATGTGDTRTTGTKTINEEELNRHGNIGVTTSQQMLESEIKLRQFNFMEEIFKDIDSILCLKIY